MARPRNYIENGSMSIQLTFSDAEIDKLNERFSVKKVKILSCNQIANGFFFNRDVVESHMYQLDLLPVVGEFDEDKEDFKGHEKGEVPYGAVIPKTAQFEEIDGETWVTAKVALWSERYSEVKDIEGNNQSMEVVNIKGQYSKEDKMYVVQDYMYDCLTILGRDIKPAFKGAGFSESFKAEFEEFKSQLLEFFEEYTNNEKKGEDTVNNLENQEVFEEEVQTEVEMEEEIQQTEEQVFEDETVSFKLSHEATRDRIFKALNPVDEEGYHSFNYWICETKDNSFVAQSMTDGLFYRFDYSETDGKIEINMESQVEAFATFLTQAEMNKLDELKANGEKFSEVNKQFAELSEKFTQLTSDIEAKDAKIAELEEFKANKEQEELEKFQAQEQAKIAEIKAKFSAKLSAEEIEGVINAEMSSDEVNKALSVAFAQKMLSEEKPQTTQVFADISDNTPKIVTNEDRLVEEAKALRNKNIK